MAVESTMLPLGTPAPHFSLETPTNELVALDQFAGQRALLVMFLCNHCPYVQHIADALGVHTTRWADLGVATVGIMSNDVDAYPADAPEHMASFAANNNWSFPYLHDADQSVARAYHAACTPDFFLFDADQTLFYRGRLDASRPGTEQLVTGEDLDAAIHAVLSGGAPPAPQLASIGCSIKWKPGTEPPWAR